MKKNSYTLVIVLPRGTRSEIVMLTSIERAHVVHGREYFILAEPDAQMRSWLVDAEVLTAKLGELIEAKRQERRPRSALRRRLVLIRRWWRRCAR